MPVKILADANFLMIQGKFKIDVLSELDRLFLRRYELFVTPPIIRELKRLAASSGSKLARQAELAIKLAEHCNTHEDDVQPGETVDDHIARVASEKAFVVATNDQDLRRLLRKLGIQTVYMRQRSHLETDRA